MRRFAAVAALLVLLGCSQEVPEAFAPPPEPTEISTPEVEKSEAPLESPSEASESPSPEASPTPTEAPALFAPGSSGEEVRDIQHRLLQIGWYEGKITGEYDEQTRLAIEGFQTKRGLPATGNVDQATLEALQGMTRKPTHDEMHNVLVPGPALLAKGAQGDKVKDLQARLKQVGWYSPDVDGVYGDTTAEGVKGFQKKRQIPVTGEVDQRTLDRLNAMTRKPTQDELNNVKPTPKQDNSGMSLDDRCLTGRVLCVSKSQRTLAWVIDGQVQTTMSVRFGSELTPTREGVFSVGWKSKDHVSTIYHTPMPYAMFFSGGQAIHYSADFAANGYNGASHGCVNVRDKGAIASLFGQVRVGDKVVVY